MAKKSKKQQKERLFEEKLVPAKSGSGELFDVSFGDDESKPVECLGITFPNDAARRAHFTEILREKLKDPEFRKIEGFPVGEDEDILALSDPPYYTACPNPFIGDFIANVNKPNNKHSSTSLNSLPFASDVSVGRYAPEALAHSYHTKVPARAIVRYILHYTTPGDIVLDPFCGTGMTALAAQMCDGTASGIKDEIAPDVPNAEWGRRYAIASDLAPAASFIAANYIHTPCVNNLEALCDTAIDNVKMNSGWMFRTSVETATGTLEAEIDHAVWSDVFICSNCGHDLVIWDLAVDAEGKIDKSEIICPQCGSHNKTNKTARKYASVWDATLNSTVRMPASSPVSLSYSRSGGRGKKEPDSRDLALLERIRQLLPHDAAPSYKVMFKDGSWGDTYRSGYCTGTTHIHQFYRPRTVYALSVLRNHVLHPHVKWGPAMLLTATAMKLTRMMRYMSDGIGRIQNGVIYFPSLSKETNPSHLLTIAKGQLLRLADSVNTDLSYTSISTNSATSLSEVPSNCIDYIFTDPPFGSNLQYSELNFIWEAWLKVFTNNSSEAVVNKSQHKTLVDYFHLMRSAFCECFRVLKPGKWITVEFHNSQNSVWNSIQEAIYNAGFVIADVRILDKKQGAFNQVVAASAVKKDLVISAYKPDVTLVERFKSDAGCEPGVWGFISSHLQKLPVFVSKNNRVEIISERNNFLLFDRMVAFHVQRGFPVPISASQFYAGLRQKYPEREGMYFLPEQVSEYDRQRIDVQDVEQLKLFVSDEKSAIQWVRALLSQDARSFKELQPIYMKEAQQVWEKHEKPLELMTILEQNFVEDSKGDWCVPDPKNESHLEQIRHRALMKEFQQYLEAKGKLKIVRTEALRAGFKECWQKKDYTTIVRMAKRIPDVVIQEDQALLMYFDNASLMLGE